MERARHRRSKSGPGVEGIRQVQKQKTRLSSDSRSCIDGNNGDHMLMLELGQRSFEQGIGMPMKKLLADEMSKQVECKRRSPSVIARLMGLEVMPPPCHVHRQQKRSPDSQWKDVSANLKHTSRLCDGRLSRRSSSDQQEFKDVYEDLEASYAVNRQCSSRWRASKVLTKSGLALNKQKLIDAKHPSTGKKLQDSKELNDTSEMLNSNNNGLLLKFLQQPDSLFANHLHDQQVDSASSIAVLKPLNSARYESRARTWRPQGDTLKKHQVTSHLKREDGLLLESPNCHRAYNSCYLSRFPLDERNEDNKLPTKVIILKPNLGKMNASGASPNPSHGYQRSCKKNKEFPGVQVAEKLPQTRRQSHGIGFSVPISMKAREIAREVTVRMRNGCDAKVNADTCSIGLKGYVGDESSYDASGSDSESETEVFNPSSGKFFYARNLCRSSHLSKSSVNGEAKKRLSERWKTTHKYQDLEEIGKGGTLGEMLGLPERETRPHHLIAKTSLGSPGDQLVNSSGSALWDGPLGIKTRNGWKNEIRENLSRSRSRSLPPSRAERSPRRSTQSDESTQNGPIIRGSPVHHGRDGAVKGNLRYKDYNLPKDSKFMSKQHHLDQHMFINETDSSSEANFEIQMEVNTKDLTEQQPIFQTTLEEDMLKSPVSDVMMSAEPESPSLSSKYPQLYSKPLDSILDGERFSSEDSALQELPKGPPEQGSSFLQCFGTEPDSSSSPKRADHSSPVSVLEVPFTEDNQSAYESFERVNAELHELRMQLQLLKMESGECPDASTLAPIEEQVAQPSKLAPEGNLELGAEGWAISYTIDVMINSGLKEADFNMFRTTWHSPDCPLDPKLFDNLENKYKNEDDTGAMRSERRLLFDKINSDLLGIFDKCINSCPWVVPRTGLNLKREEGVGNVLEKLMKQDFCVAETPDEAALRWGESKGEIEAVGNEIEEMLIAEIINEVVCC